jgi:broad specificity phosphatase PhoE
LAAKDMELIFVRHGATPFNREQKVQSRTDIEFNDTGLRQAHKLALSLDKWKYRD